MTIPRLDKALNAALQIASSPKTKRRRGVTHDIHDQNRPTQAEFGSLLEAQRWCEAEIGWLLLETKASLKFNRTRGVCRKLFERNFL